ncbi:type II toxin-antitoxin system RelE/ParE family toxin [Desulfosporosinus orientis]|uniref:type II toxin-antitoxin system RelE/ParE family toxin n=1 Tax=Desulfosporosinus orientis TaxID=1563 RepID=UPI00031BF024|nr:type II toxin-antitoxin system RelE/ParE family toxin [Desulfosporosinus orientis]
MNKLLYSPEALNDLDEIWAYINNELLNPAAAQKTVSDDSEFKLHKEIILPENSRKQRATLMVGNDTVSSSRNQLVTYT